MIRVQFPEPQFRLKRRGEKQYIFDSIRKKWLQLTEEEWVRQNMVAFFVQTMRYPKETIALEKEIRVNGLKRRFDILIYNKDAQPWMLVECKAPSVSLTEQVLQQALRYNTSVLVQWILITNGESTMAWSRKEEQILSATSLPLWGE
jgi:hypothetical protein